MYARSGRPRKACSRCVHLKIRCSGEKPSCKRCFRLLQDCRYDGPGVARNWRQSPEPVVTETLPPSLPPRNRDPVLSSKVNHVNTATDSSYHYNAPLLLHPSEVDCLGIPSALILTLTEVYFSHIYNAQLLLHKPSFLKAVAQGTVRTHLALSVCALAAIFYQDASGQATFKDQGFMTEWAHRAGKLVFQEVESPHEDNIVTFINLTLFFYSLGMWNRAHVHKANGMQTAYILGLGHDRPDDNLQSELRRRRFWACYLVNCQSSEPMAVVDTCGDIPKLSLPWRDEDFDMETPSTPRVTLDSDQNNGGVFCELTRIMAIWSEVTALLKLPESDMTAKIAAIHALDSRISKWRSKLPTALELTRSKIPSVAVDSFPKLVIIHAVYHQCLCALHSSIVPLFSWTSGDDNWASARQLSAQIAFEHACQTSELLEAVLDYYPMLNAIPCFAGYAAYCACAIQIPFMWCSEPGVRKRAYSNVRTNIRMINILSKYWKFASMLAMYIHYLYKVHASDPVSLENEPKYVHPTKLTNFKYHAKHMSNSILAFNQILWTDEGRCLKTGEVPIDLGIEGGGDFREPLSHNPVSSNVPIEFQSYPQQLPPDPGLPLPNPNFLNAGPAQAGSELYPQEGPSEDSAYFRPFLGIGSLGLFPPGEMQDFDFGQFDVSSIVLESFDKAGENSATPSEAVSQCTYCP